MLGKRANFYLESNKKLKKKEKLKNYKATGSDSYLWVLRLPWFPVEVWATELQGDYPEVLH